jgi:hypothetical protein
MEAQAWKTGGCLTAPPATLARNWESRKAFVQAPWQTPPEVVIQDRETAVKSHDQMLSKPANGSPAATDTIDELKPLADMAKQSAVTSASLTNPLATLTPSAAALDLASPVDSSLLPPSTANPYTGAGAGAGAMVNPFATLGGLGENLAMPQPRGHSQTLSPLVAMLPQWPAAAPAMDGNAMSR